MPDLSILVRESTQAVIIAWIALSGLHVALQPWLTLFC